MFISCTGIAGITLCCYFEKGMVYTISEYIEKEREERKLYKNLYNLYYNENHFVNYDEMVNLPDRIKENRHFGRRRSYCSYIYCFKQFYLELKSLLENYEKFYKKNLH